MENTKRLIMEGELKETQKSILAGDANATPIANYVSTKSPASPSKVLIITPEQIAKLGLTQQIKNVVESQVASKALRKNRPRVTKLKIIDDAPSNSSNKDAATLEVNTGAKSQKDESNKKEDVRGSFTASNVNELENMTKKPKEKEEISMNAGKIKNVKQLKQKQDITGKQSVGNRNLLEDVIVEQDKIENDKSMKLDTTKGSDIATETGSKMTAKSLNSTLTNPVISSMKSKLLSILETGVTSARKPSTSVNDAKPVYNAELVTNSKNITKKRRQSNSNPSPSLKTSAEVLNKPENISSKTNTGSTSGTNLREKNSTVVLINDSENTIASNPDLDLLKKDVTNSLTEIKTNKTSAKRRLGKVQPNITKIMKKNRQQASILHTPELKDTNCTKSSVVESSNNIKNTNLAKEALEPAGETRPHKIHVLSNEQISLPQTYIEQMLKENFNQKINIYNPTLKRSISNDSSSTKLNSDLEQDKMTNISGELSKDVQKASCDDENNDSPPASENASLTGKNLSGTNQSPPEISGHQQNILLTNTGDLRNLEPDSIIKEITTKEDVNISNQNSAQNSIFDRSPKKEDIEDLISNEQSINTVATTSIVASKVERIEAIRPHNQEKKEKFATEKCLVDLKNLQETTSHIPVTVATQDINDSKIMELDDSEIKDKSSPSEPKLSKETVNSVQVTTPNIPATASKKNIIHPKKNQTVSKTLKAIKSGEKIVEETVSVVAVTANTQDISQPQKMKTKEKSHPSDVAVSAVTQSIRKPEKIDSVKLLKTSEPNRNLQTTEKPNTSDPATTTMQSACQPQNMKNIETLKISNSEMERNEKMHIRRLPPTKVLSKPEFSESAIHKLTNQLPTDDFSKLQPSAKLEKTTKPSGTTSTQISKNDKPLGSVQNLDLPNKVERITAINERGKNTVGSKSSQDHLETIPDFSKLQPSTKLEKTTKPSSGTATQISKNDKPLGSVQNLDLPNKVERITAISERGKNTVGNKSSQDHLETIADFSKLQPSTKLEKATKPSSETSTQISKNDKPLGSVQNLDLPNKVERMTAISERGKNTVGNKSSQDHLETIADLSKLQPSTKLEKKTKPSSGTSTQISKNDKPLGSVQNLDLPNKVEIITAINEREKNTVGNESLQDHIKTKNVLQKPEIPVSRKLEFVDSEQIKEDVPLTSLPIQAKPLSVIHSEDCLEESVNEHIFKGEEIACPALPSKQVTPTPKKRGRKKKSEMVAKEEVQFRPKIPTVEVSASKRSGRKRHVVDYSALAEGVDFDEATPKKPKKEKIKNEHNIVDSSTEKLLPSIKSETLSNQSIHEVASIDNEVNSFLPVDNTADTEATTEKQREHEITLMRIEDEYSSEEDVGVLKRKISQKLTKEPIRTSLKRKTSQKLTKEPIRTSVSQGLKRKRGRPRGRTNTENSLCNKVMTSIFQHINTPTKSNENIEAEEQTISHNNGTLDNVKQGFGAVQPQSIVDLKNEPVTCGVCYAEVEKNNWQYHKLRKHNNLTWRLGEPPLDLSDQKLTVTILTDLYKRKKPLFCEFCGQSKKSVMGFLSHKSVCQKSSEEIQSMRIKCEFCDRSVMPVSMSAHLKFCRVLNVEKNMAEYQKPEVIQETPSTSKRKAATKAEKLIKIFKDDGTVELVSENKPKNTRKWYVNFDFHPTFFGKRWIQHQITQNGRTKCIFAECEFESSDADEMANHIWTCNRKPTVGYTCKFCMSTHTTEDDIVEHMQQNHDRAHSVLSSLDEESEDNSIGKEEELVGDGLRDYKECKAKLPPKANLMHGIKFLLMNRFCAPTTGIKYPPAFDWTLKFCQENLSTRNLYPNWRINRTCYEKLSPDLVIKYLPRVRYSACTARIETKKFVDPLKLDYDWKRYKLFESEKLHNGTSIIFCGGSIFSMAWLPTPYDETNCKQILAVSTDSSMDKEYRLNDVYREPSLIQFWNCGLLSNEEDIDDKPRLQFCIAHDYGPAWCLEWCPSGCYDTEQIGNTDCLQRLGVLAVGCADGHIYIYSINLPDQTSKKILKTKPVLKLVLDSVSEETVSGIEAHVTKISWSKVSGHRFLIAGYANGLVAIYDLSSTSVLLRVGYDQNDVEMLMPYRTFSAHYHAITALSVYHLNDGRRWLMTGSVDRSIKYWDLENPTVPITNFMKLIVTDGVWLNHWLSTVQTFDDSCGGGLTYTAAHQLRNFESETTSIMHSNSRVSAITGNDWVNGFVQGNIVGEVKGFFPHQMFYSMDCDKSSRIKKVILGYARLVEKNLNIQERIREEQEKLKHVNNKPAIPVDGDTMIKTKNFNINVDYAKPEPGTYKEAEEKYGLVFCDMRVNCIKEFPANIDSYFKSNKVNKLYASRPNIYPMESINKVVFNPNRGSFLHLATGYQVGFVRISCLRFLNRP